MIRERKKKKEKKVKWASLLPFPLPLFLSSLLAALLAVPAAGALARGPGHRAQIIQPGRRVMIASFLCCRVIRVAGRGVARIRRGVRPVLLLLVPHGGGLRGRPVGRCRVRVMAMDAARGRVGPAARAVIAGPSGRRMVGRRRIRMHRPLQVKRPASPRGTLARASAPGTARARPTGGQQTRKGPMAGAKHPMAAMGPVAAHLTAILPVGVASASAMVGRGDTGGAGTSEGCRAALPAWRGGGALIATTTTPSALTTKALDAAETWARQAKESTVVVPCGASAWGARAARVGIKAWCGCLSDEREDGGRHAACWGGGRTGARTFVGMGLEMGMDLVVWMVLSGVA